MTTGTQAEATPPFTLAQLQHGGGDKPPVTVIYGKPGIGKTTLAAYAPSPFFVMTEDGLRSPDLKWVPNLGVHAAYEAVLQALAFVYENAAGQGWKSLTVDSIDRLDPLVVNYTCRMNGWTKLADCAYGTGNVAYRNEWRQFMDAILAIRNDCQMSIFLLGHHQVRKLTPPDAEPYNKFGLAVPVEVEGILVNDADNVLFATQPVTTVSKDLGFKKTATRAIADSARLYCQERGAHVAKNRYGMPEFIPMQWEQLAPYVPAWAG